ncbi:MAG: restriction endonuclease subunit S [Bacteroidales bacterium]|nr:restriction endonuclease subunit S [Bacteroidales bacterium]
MTKNIEYPKYPAYKDSGVDWLGEVPEHWELKKLKHMFFEKKHSSDIELNCGSISFGKVVYKDDERVPLATKMSYQVVSKGDFLVNPLNLNYDLISLRIALSEIDVVVSAGYIVLKNSIELDKNYFKWLLHRFDVAYMKLLGSGVRQTINFSDIGNCELVAPPLPEQTRIAAFLDRKTAQIDQAIGQKERLIELLKERRQILIQNAVTRGLNPNVKMKDSGVEWIGEVPAHWEVKKLKYILKSQGRIGFKGYAASDLVNMEDGALTLGATHLDWEGNLDLSEPVYISWKKYYESPEIMVSKDDIIIVQRGSTCGKVALIKNDIGPTTINPSLVLLKEIAEQPEYVFLGIKVVLNGILNLVSTTAIPMLTQFQINNIVVPVPPKSEQISISEFIDSVSKKISEAVNCKQSEIEKLREYKAVLINSAVTGKIKI